MATYGRRVLVLAVFLLICDVYGDDIVNKQLNSKSGDNKPLERVKRLPDEVDILKRGGKPLGFNAGQGQGGDHQMHPPVGGLPQRQGVGIDTFNNVHGGANLHGQIPVENNNLQGRHSLPMAGQKARKASFKLSTTEECVEDAQKYCAGKMKNNFALLDCLQSDSKIIDDISLKCHHFIWQYKRNLTRDDRFEYAADEVCSTDLKKIKECGEIPKGTGMVVPCLVENKKNITQTNCKTYINKMARIVFSDYRLVYNFVQDCEGDIQKLQCGRIQKDEPKSLHSQGETLHCLANKVNKLNTKCKKQILRVAELQADDFNLDRPLYYACRNARERFCVDTPAGHGRVYKCLFKHKFDSEMPEECRNQLTKRQQLIAEDVKVDHSFMEECRADIRKYKCFAAGRLNKEQGPDFKRAAVLICLENQLKKKKDIVAECIQEMNDLRKSLMEDYQVDPDIVANCGPELKGPCKAHRRQGNTLHCLMDLAKDQGPKEDKITDQCQRAIEGVLQEADVGSDYRMDQNLKMACDNVVQAACPDIHPGDAKVMDCLMDQLDSEHMTDECEEKLMEIQYFIVRDFRLDHTLYKHCHQDATKLCYASEDWFQAGSMTPNNAPLVLPCLYRHMKDHVHDKNLQVSRACTHEIRRVMKHRAAKIELDAEIERLCVKDLGRYCSDEPTGKEGQYGKGEELACLQDNFDDLEDGCQEIVANRTEDQSLFIELDHIITKSCMPMIDKYCQDETEDGEAEDVMECLIENKHKKKMDPKCLAGIEHHQLTSLKDFRFNHKFKEACKHSVVTLCKGKKTKYDVVACLSEHVRNDTVLENKHRVDKICRKQLRYEILARGEEIQLDKEVSVKCGDDINRHCSTVENTEVVECLKTHEKKLTPRCHKVIFVRQKEDVLIGDYKLNQACKEMIETHCDRELETEGDVLHCLEKHKEDPKFDATCRTFVIRRQVMQNKDYRLNPTLRKSCKMDIPKFCKGITSTQKNDEELEGKVINCLRKQFIINRLSAPCTDVIRDLIKDSALNYLEDPVLANACKDEIESNCAEDHKSALRIPNQAVKEDGKGRVIECLKKALESKTLKNRMCINEVARVTQEAYVDIQVDPLLHMACTQDIPRRCSRIEPGHGKLMNCLLVELEDNPNALTPDCRKLLKARKDLWEYSVRVAPVEGFSEIFDQITISPQKNYILGILCTIIGIIFLMGITCGRVTKRPKGDKNR